MADKQNLHIHMVVQILPTRILENPKVPNLHRFLGFICHSLEREMVATSRLFGNYYHPWTLDLAHTLDFEEDMQGYDMSKYSHAGGQRGEVSRTPPIYTQIYIVPVPVYICKQHP